MRVARLLAALVVAGSVTSCASVFNPTEHADLCGYTWYRAKPPARLVTVVVDPDTRRWPGVCAEWGTRGCTSWHEMGPETWAEIRLAEPPGPASGCSTIEHEYKHAAGLDHREQYQHRPRDFTR